MTIDDLVKEARRIVKLVTEPYTVDSTDFLDRSGKQRSDSNYASFYEAFETRVTNELAKGLITEQEAAIAKETLEDSRRRIKDDLFAAASAYAAQGNISDVAIKTFLETIPQYRARVKMVGRKAEQVLTLSRADVDRFYTFAKREFELSTKILAHNQEGGLQTKVTYEDVNYVVMQALAEALCISYDTTLGFAPQFSVTPVQGSFEAGKRR